MNRLLLCCFVGVAAFATPASAGESSISADRWDGDVREVVLSNGLRVLLKEDHAAPVATFVVYYRVGSRNEHTGNTGSTHLLEHLQFKGTKKFPGKSAVWGALSRIGASFNATTAQDRTNFYETVPIEQLPFAIELEADRMRNSTFTDADRSIEMTVVRNELERGENEPGTLLHNLTWSTSFISHPYHHPVIGWRSDVENVPTEQLRHFYDTYYQPDNAVAVAVGDFKTDDVLKLVQQHFGGFPGGHQFPPVYTQEEKQRGERRVVIHKPGELALLEMGWHFPAFNSPDVVPLKVLQLVLAGTLDVNEMTEPLPAGISNRLYQGLVETQLATVAEMGYQVMMNDSLGALMVELRPGVSHEKAETALRAILQRLRDEPVTVEELTRAKSRAHAVFALAQDGTFGKAMALGYYGTLGDWRFLRDLNARLDKVTREDVQRVARTYFNDDGATVAWFVPDQVKGAAIEEARRTHLPSPWAAYRKLDDAREARAVEARAATSGRSTSTIAPRKKTLENGLRIVVQPTPTNPTFALSGAVLAGSVHETTKDIDVSGVTADMLERGTQQHTKLALAGKLEDVGAGLVIEGSFESVGISGQGLKGDLDRVLDVLAEELMSPAFPEAERKKVVDEHAASVLQGEDSTRVRGRRALMQALYPKGHPFTWTTRTT